MMIIIIIVMIIIIIITIPIIIVIMIVSLPPRGQNKQYLGPPNRGVSKPTAYSCPNVPLYDMMPVCPLVWDSVAFPLTYV